MCFIFNYDKPHRLTEFALRLSFSWHGLDVSALRDGSDGGLFHLRKICVRDGRVRGGSVTLLY